MRPSDLVGPGLLALVLGGCSLAGDVTPPAGLAPNVPEADLTRAAPIAEPVSALPPVRPPDARAGSAIYAEKCQPCHGASGWGDGPQAADLPNPPAALADPDAAWSAEPAAWYSVVTLGRMDRFMPGFASLTDAERWDVVAYALTLSQTPEQLAQGQALYEVRCAGCHGPDGRGGPEGPDLTRPDLYAQSSSEELDAVIAAGVGDSMPGFANELSPDERRALVSFVRSLAFAAEEVPPVAAAKATVRGRVVNGTSGARTAADLEVTLHGFDGQEEVVNVSTTVDAQGDFEFEDVEQVPGRLFVVTAEYQGVIYGSEVRHLDAEVVEMPLTIFEATRDTSSVRVDRLHLLFHFPNESSLEVVELWLLSNRGDRTVAAEDGVLKIELPDGAGGLFFDGGALGERFLAMEGGFIDTAPLRPGTESGQLAFSYTLPYNRRLEFARRVPYAVEAVIVLAPEGGIRLRGPGLVDVGRRAVGETTYHHYEMSAVPAGGEVSLTISGRPGAPGETALGGHLVFGAAALAVALAGVAVWWFAPRRRAARLRHAELPDSSAPASERDALLQAIADLDDAFDAGQVAEDDYREQRQDLKRRLAEILERRDD